MSMNNTELLKAMGEIDEKYISEVLSEDSAGGKVKKSGNEKRGNRSKVIRFVSIAVPAVAALLIAFVAVRSTMMTGTNTTSSDSAMSAPAQIAVMTEEAYATESADADMDGGDAGAMYDEVAEGDVFSVAEAAAGTSGTQSTYGKNDLNWAPGEAMNEAEEENSDSMLQIANPFMECEDLGEAAQIAGFDFIVPDVFRFGERTISEGRSIRAVRDDMIEVIYFAGKEYDSDNEIIRLRKAKGTDDISGDYNTYPYEKTVDADGIKVTVRGQSENEITVAIWNADGYSYSIDSRNKVLDTKAVLETVKTITGD